MIGPSEARGLENHRDDATLTAKVTRTELVGINEVAIEPVELTRDEMTELLADGQAEILAHHVTDFISLQGSWWILATDQTWIRIADPELQATLDRYQRRMQGGLFG